MYIEDLICRDLPLSAERVGWIAENSHALYHSFLLGDREIDAPSAEIKLVQCWISDFIRAETEELPAFITAYEPKSSIRKNAEMHKDKRHHLCVDIKSFFPSCTTEKVASVFKGLYLSRVLPDGRHKLPVEDVGLLVRLSTLRGSLSVGSPSSPALANRIMLPIDLELQAALGPTYVYSRYSDDICISSDSWIDESELLPIIDCTLMKNGFRLNDSKTRCYGRGNARRITGVYITPSGRLSVGSKRKKAFERSLYQYLVHGEGSASSLLGMLNFCASIEPSYASKIITKYSNYGIAAECEGLTDALCRGI